MITDDLSDWTIGYIRNGQPRVLTIQSAKQPDLATIAVRMRNEPGFEEFVIPDALRGSSAEDDARAFFKLNGIPTEQINVNGPGDLTPYRDS